MAKRKRKEQIIRNIVVVSDLHCGCQLGLCPPTGARLDHGGRYEPNRVQKEIWKLWDCFWNDWVPRVTRGEEFDVVINGDSMDGSHHRATHQISHNLHDQENIAYEVLAPVREMARKFYMTRGTEAHVGPSGVQEESLAERLGAVANSEGQRSRFELWKKIGRGIVHFAHHIGTAGSMAYESSALMREASEMTLDAGRNGTLPPNVIVRSHRHRFLNIDFPLRGEFGIVVTTPGWQGKTPFAFRVPGGRVALPQFGGVCVKAGDEDSVYIRKMIHHVDREGAE